MQTEPPGRENVPEELPEGDRPDEMPQVEPDDDDPEPGRTLPEESPEIGRPAPGTGDEGRSG